MQTSHPNERSRWLVTIAVVVLGAVLLLLWWRRDSSTPPAVVLQTAETAQPSAIAALLARIAVDVTGAVERPGLYYFDDGARVGDAIAAAGGFAPDAQRDAVNLAVRLRDEQQVRIPRVGDVVAPPGGEASVDAEVTPAAAIQEDEAQVVPGNGTEIAQPAAQMADTTSRIDLNTAEAVMLEQLPGIGPVMAQRIVEHRAAHGPFTGVEQLLDVEGIGEATLDAVRDLVVVMP